jgi:putative transposase
VKFSFIKKNEGIFPVKKQCEVMNVSRSGYYAWRNRPAKIISEFKLKLYRRTKALFKESRQSLGSRQLMKNLRKEGFDVGRDKVIRLMETLDLKVKQRIAYKVTTMRKHSHSVADNIVDQQFNPEQANEIWAGDVTYLRTGQGWMYLAVVMDLYSRRIIGWSIHKRMTVDLVERAMQMALNIRQPAKGLIFHSDRGSQYTSHRFQKQLKDNNIIASMSGRGACWDNAVVERFFGSLKNEWLLNIYHLTRYDMKEDVEAYIRYYNQIRLHTSNGDCSPIEFEQSTINVSYAA